MIFYLINLEFNDAYSAKFLTLYALVLKSFSNLEGVGPALIVFPLIGVWFIVNFSKYSLISLNDFSFLIKYKG